MIGKVYYFISAILFVAGLFILLTPTLLTPDLIYPERVDSAYIVFHAQQQENDLDTIPVNPEDVELNYSTVHFTNNGVQLNGWFVASTDTPANTIIIVHD